MNVITENDLISWVRQSIRDENFHNCKIEFAGKSEKGEGYLGEIVYVNVSGTTNDGGTKTLDLVIKYSKNHSYLRKVSPVKSAFRREIFVYDQIFPIFDKFQREKHIQDVFGTVPKCYKTIILDDMEVLVLNNIRKLGYEMHDGKKTLNLCHLKALLVEYAKLHALSELLVKDAGSLLSDLTEEEEPQSAIIHGDCWNNNFMFFYPNKDKSCPSKVAILDWQISGLRSPAIDLSFLIYANSSKQELRKFDELMDVYYASFSQFVQQLGSEPDQVFPYADLRKHWKKYSLFGLLFVPMVWRLVLTNKEEVPVFEDLKEGQEFGSVMVRDAIGDRDAYYERLKPVVSHFFDCPF
ncbi:hypothetical protein NQ318_018865 [Aromia moschata]|uniref:CHK kinase-like domain-containing protein n=1 Tax=Aromia moschata TaxID=1265417 RepID=A0AAV8ZGQ0_9CUCU|nr:hypothetical protein NQ318_018865 [Aromia moschata]